jgi:hypothetical protein
MNDCGGGHIDGLAPLSYNATSAAGGQPSTQPPSTEPTLGDGGGSVLPNGTDGSASSCSTSTDTEAGTGQGTEAKTEGKEEELRRRRRTLISAELETQGAVLPRVL